MKFIKLFESFNHELHYYAFDIDDNLFHMPTVIHLEKKDGDRWVPIDVSTHEFAKIRTDKDNYRILNNNPDDAFSEFRDDGPRGENAFIEDMKISIKNKEFGPSWPSFVECLKGGHIFALITARGNSPKTYRKSVEYIIDNVLSDEDKYEMYNNCLKHSYIFNRKLEYDRIWKGPLSKSKLIKAYLDNCDYYGVSSPEFISEFGGGSSLNPEKAKEMALDKFIEKCNVFGKMIGAKSVSIGFSDDDPKNIDHVEKFFKEKSALNHDFSHKMKLNLYKTTDRTILGGERQKFNEVNSSVQPDGMASSIIPFSKFTSLSSRLFPSTPESSTDPTTHIRNLELDHIGEISKSIKSKRRRKSKKGRM